MSTAARRLEATELNTLDRQLKVLKGKKKHRIVSTIKSGLFLTVALMVLAVTLVYYINLLSDITGYSKDIGVLESKLNQIRLDNDENYSRITSDVDLEQIRTIAIQELGMKYADEGQIITFDGDGSDYVRQTGAIPSYSGK